MIKANIKSNFGFKFPYEFDKPVNIWIDNFQGIDENIEGTKVFVGIEPQEIMGLNNQVMNAKDKFDYILTYDEDLLRELENAILFEYGTKWVEIDKYGFPEKKFSVSTVCGHKAITKHHKNRHKLWLRQEEIEMPKNFFLSRHGGPRLFPGNQILGESKFPMFDSMFHICIENIPKKYFFTEKLIDCLLCKTIPIYRGCENISDYFNMDGIIVVNSVDEIIKTCNMLREGDYADRIKAVEENQKRAFDWIDYPERLSDKIKELI